MSHQKRCAVFFLHFLFGFLAVTAQNPQKKLKDPFQNRGTLNSQFDYLSQKSTSYNDYKIVLRKTYETIQKNVRDSMAMHRKKKLLLDAKIHELTAQNDAQKKRLQKLEKSLFEAQTYKDSMTLFEKRIHKDRYHFVIISCLWGLLTLAVFFLYQYKKSIRLTQTAEKNFETLQEEFNSHQKNALKRQQELNRKLQDEILKTQKKTKTENKNKGKSTPGQVSEKK
jgi:hypothetical protein